MQTILGASGQIGRELAVHLKRGFTGDIRLVLAGRAGTVTSTASTAPAAQEGPA